MSSWLSIALGIIAGATVIAGTVYVAVRPYLQPDHKPWMPDARDGPEFHNDYASPAGGGDGLDHGGSA